MRFRHKLDGYDEDWRGPVAERQVAYTNLPPGTYRFRLTASNNDDGVAVVLERLFR